MTHALTVTRDEAAAMLRVSVETIDRMLKDGRLYRVQELRRVRIPRAAVDDLLRPKPLPVVGPVVGENFHKVRKMKLRQRVSA